MSPGFAFSWFLLVATGASIGAAPSVPDSLPPSMPVAPATTHAAVQGNAPVSTLPPSATPTGNQASPPKSALPVSGATRLLPPKSAPKSQVKSPASVTATQPLTGVAFSLAAVIGLFLVCAFLFSNTVGKRLGPLPKEVVEVLGRMPIPGRQQLELLRVGRKLILVCHAPGGVETLTEIVDPEEVDRLVGICHQNKPESSSSNFREVLLEMGREKTKGGFWGSKDTTTALR